MHYIKVLINSDYRRMIAEGESKTIPNFLFCLSPINNNWIWNFITRAFRTARIPKTIRRILLMKSPRFLWYYLVFSKNARRIFRQEKDVCVITTALRSQLLFFDCFKILKRKFPHVKLVYVFEDTINFYLESEFFELNEFKSVFDLIYSYNSYDVAKFGFLPYRECIHEFSFDENNELPDTDLFFVGYNKGRLNTIISIFEKCTQYGLKCDFYVMGVGRSDQAHSDCIHYNEQLSYTEVLQHCQRTKCIVNIIQEGAEGFTLRDNECIYLNKVLLTNNKYIINSAFYTPDKVIMLDDLDRDINKILNQSDDVLWNGREEYSLTSYYHALESDLKKK